MSFHGGAAMTLFGRPQDELSHVLIHPASLERFDADFWWPGHNLPGKVELAAIPFVRVRERIARSMLSQNMDYKRYVQQVNAAIAGTDVVLELIADTLTLVIAGGSVKIKLVRGDFDVYRVLVEWAQGAVKGAGPDGVGSNHGGWLTAPMIQRPQDYSPNPIVRLHALGASQSTFKKNTSESKEETPENKAFGQAVSRVGKAIAKSVGDKVLANRLLSQLSATRKTGEPARFGLRLAPHEIAIRNSEGGPEVGNPFAGRS